MKKKFYVTTSIAYANSAPHIGYAMEVLQADALARFHRLLGEDVLFLSGTDENGAKMKKTAEEKGVEVQKFADENSAKFRKLLNRLNVSNDDFVRTTDQVRHWPAAQKIWKELVKAEDIYKDSYEGYYCVGCEAYLTEKDLVDGKCPNHQKTPDKIKEENYFFRLSKYSKTIQEKIESGELKIIPESRKNEILNVLRSGLKDISFSRPKKVLNWGVPVPGDDSQIMYVWCDALTNYISALGYGDNFEKELTNCHSRVGGNPLPPQSINSTNNSLVKKNERYAKFQKYWPADIHVIGKDILRFHAAIWPAMLISAKLPLPKKIFVHGFITSGGQKMSKSVGNVIDPFEVIDKYKSVDALRYFLLKEIPSGGDGDFSYERFEEIYQADLANGLGNLAARVLAMAEKTEDGMWDVECRNLEFETRAKNTWLNYYKFIDSFKLNEVLEIIRKFMSICDEYIEKNKPWQMEGEDKAKTIYNLLESLRHIAWMIRPFMPETSDKIFTQLFADEKERVAELSKTLAEAQKWSGLKPGAKIKKGAGMFPRLAK